jgi:hypothetical protein
MTRRALGYVLWLAAAPFLAVAWLVILVCA